MAIITDATWNAMVERLFAQQTWMMGIGDEAAGLVPMRPAASLKPQPVAPPKPELPATALRLAPLWRGW